jgi:hypothetical protein
MTTLGTALARLGRTAEAAETLERATTIAEQSGNVENAGLALVTLIEEVSSGLSTDELRERYQRADDLLERSQHPETLARLRSSARRVFASQKSDSDNISDADVRSYRLAKLKMLISNSQKRHNKQVVFTGEALEAMDRFFLIDEMKTLETIVEETIAAASPDVLITSEAVEIVALRGQAPRGNFAQPWAEFSLKGELREPEKRFIELALKAAEGKISIAARLLGFNHNELLTSIIKSRYPELLAARTPTVPRKRSIIRKPQARKR